MHTALQTILERSDAWLQQHTRRWQWPLHALLWLLVLATFYTLAVSFWRGPFRDFWEALPFVQHALAGQATWAEYWDQYGYSHRPLLTRWLWVMDYRWTNGSNQGLLAVSLLMQCLVAANVWRVVRTSAIDRRLHGLLMSAVFFCLFSATQLFNLLHTFDVQWFMTVGCVVWALAHLLTAVPACRSRRLVVVWLLLWLASLNNFSALVMWPIAIVLACLTGYRLRDVGLFAGATLLYLGFYFYQLPTNAGDLVQAAVSEGKPSLWLQMFWHVLVVFPVWYLSNPLSFQLSAEGPLHVAWPFSWFAPCMAGALLLWAIRTAWCTLRRPTVVAPAVWFGLALVAYGYGVAVVTSLGRGLFWDNVYALRYQNIVLLFWIGVLVLLIARARRQHLAALGSVLLLLAVLASRVDWYHDFTLKMGNRTRDAHLALRVGLADRLDAIQATVSRSHLIEDTGYNLVQEAQFLREHALGMYADPDWQVPALAILQKTADCAEVPAGIDVHGEPYARLGVTFAQPVHYSLLAWFDGDNAPGLLIATREDRWWPRLRQSVRGFTDYAGFADRLPQLAPEQVYALAGAQWCHLRIR